jgi:hypothetical protein
LTTITTSLLVFIIVFAAALLGMLLRKVLPQHHFSAETKESVKVAMGLVATMSALILGLLIAAASDKYDKESEGVTAMAAKIIYLDRMLANYGPEAKDARDLFRTMVERVARQMWPESSAAEAQLDPSATRAETVFVAIHKLSPQNDL